MLSTAKSVAKMLFTDPDGTTQYIVMQLVEGRDLAAILHDRGRISSDDAVEVAIAVASALEAAHRRGIVHRDVKPGNILITDDGDVKVTDFGIARAVSEASMTVTGTTLGSVHYFSPEQARGDEVTGRSDVYALGIVLYEMLTGHRPFEGDSAAGVALKRLTENPPRPMVAGQPLPPGLEAILRRALEREPDRRSEPGARTRARCPPDWLARSRCRRHCRPRASRRSTCLRRSRDPRTGPRMQGRRASRRDALSGARASPGGSGCWRCSPSCCLGSSAFWVPRS